MEDFFQSFELIHSKLILFNLIGATLLGALIGIERQWRQRMAGLRTNALVSTGAALFVTLDKLTDNGGDKTRIAAQIVSGIGFLGAGVIMREGLSIRGLNTAATLWCSAAIGVLSGFGLWGAALSGTILILSINLLLKPVALEVNRIKSSQQLKGEMKYAVRARCRKDVEPLIRSFLIELVSRGGGLQLQGLQSADVPGEIGLVEVTCDIDTTAGQREPALEDMVAQLRSRSGVTLASWHLKQALEEVA